MTNSVRNILLNIYIWYRHWSHEHLHPRRPITVYHILTDQLTLPLFNERGT